MRITRLDLYGFKSFPDRTTFEFGPGVSCVVGPNGSGKSNVVDAMRWCIGEQSARTLRGAEMLDVIFAGSAERTPVGFAEVRMTFASDTGEPFPGVYARMAELQIGRRLHRDGTSEYAINGVKCRRRDVLDVFLDTGIGSDLYSFIAQGQVERIVHASPMDRRAIFDEVAGISRYTARRAEAQQRLEATAAQLDRAADVADEMTRRLDALKRQVVKAAEFRRLRALIRQEEIALALVRYREFAADRKALHERLRSSEVEAASARRELARRQEDLTQRREEIAVVDASAAQWRDEVAELDARARELEGTRSHQEQRARELLAQASRHVETAASIEAEVAADRVREVAGAERIATLETELVEAEAARATRNEDEARALQQTELARLAFADADKALREATVAAATSTERVVGHRRELQSLEARLSAAAADVEGLRGRSGSATLALARTDGDLEEAAQALATLQRSADTAADASRTAAQVAADAEGRRDAVELALEQGRAALDASVERVAQEAEAMRRDAEDALAAAQTELEQERQAVRDRGQELVARLADVAARRSARLGALRADRQRIDAEIAQMEGEVSRCRAERVALQGAKVVGLEDATPLADRWALDAAGLQAWVERVGDRVLLPQAAGVEEVLAIAASLEPGSEARLTIGTDLQQRWDATWTACADPKSAVEHHLRTGGAAYAPGLRIDSDGVVVVGRAADVADRVSRRARLDLRIEDLMASMSGSRRALIDSDQEIVTLVGEGPAGIDLLAWAAERLVEQERAQTEQARAGLREQLSVVESRGERRVSEARARLADAVADSSATRDRARTEGLLRLESARAGLTEATQAARDARAHAIAARELALAAATRVVEQQAAIARLQASRTVLAASLATDEHASAQAATTAAALTASIDATRADIMTSTRAAEAAARVVAVAEAALADAEGALAARREAAAEVQRRDGDARATVAALVERLAAERAALQEAQRRAGEGERRAARERSAAQESERAAAIASEAAANAAREAGVAAEERGRAWDRLNRDRGRAAKLKEALVEAEQEGRVLQERAEAHTTRVAELEARLNQVRVDLEVLRRSMDDRYQVGLAGLLDRLTIGPLRLDVADEAREGLEIAGHHVAGVEDLEITSRLFDDAAAIAGLVERNRLNREAVARLGEVHLGALDEYADLTTRHDALLAQRGDLEASVTDIRHAIARMNKTCRQRFRDAYDRVNEAFQEVYPRLVGGGTARLSLTDEEDLLQSGVEIFVQPPGKRLQNLTLLSGGEKAMTAIALVIAILKVRPSPFCVLDEVDAPLDEANGARFNDILREMSAVSQFVVITHNRKTMECADTLYGVTMGRPGVSTLVSVNLAG